jgi:F-type H+-transporting ATPase subunit c
MDLTVLKFIAMGIAIGLGVIGPGVGLGLATKGIIESVARKPEAEGQISKYFYIGAGLIEACALYALLVVILIAWVL